MPKLLERPCFLRVDQKRPYLCSNAKHNTTRCQRSFVAFLVSNVTNIAIIAGSRRSDPSRLSSAARSGLRLHEVDANAVRPGQHRRLLAPAELIDQRVRLLAKRHASLLHRGCLRVKILRLPTQMVDGTPLARREYATPLAGRKQPQ